MAEATDRPQGAEESSSSAAAPPPRDGVTAWPERVASPGDLGAMPLTASESYRPLSLLAVAAFVLSVVYALVVLVGSAIALFNHIPCLMPGWTFLLPLAVLLLCWLARNRIRAAEGTVSGLAFTVWSIRLTVVVGLSYLAYYGFTFFAVRLQAEDCANKFFKQLQADHLERAFLQTTGNFLAPDANEADLRDMLEIRFNSPTTAAPGPFTQFRQSQFVRMIEMGEGAATFKPESVIDWGYVKGGYQVVLKYHISTPLVEFEMNVDTFGQDNKTDKGRQWQVVMPGGPAGLQPSSVKMTPRGDDLMAKTAAAQAFALGLEAKIARQQWDEVYLDSLPPAERDRLRKGQKSAAVLEAAPLAGLAPLALGNEVSRDFLKGRQALAEGKQIPVDDKNLWTIKRDRDDILKHLRQTFRPRPQGRPVFLIHSQPKVMPRIRSGEGQLTILFDEVISYLDEETGAPKYVAEGYLVVSADEEKSRDPSAWRIQAIDVRSARTPPSPERRR